MILRLIKKSKCFPVLLLLSFTLDSDRFTSAFEALSGNEFRESSMETISSAKMLINPIDEIKEVTPSETKLLQLEGEVSGLKHRLSLQDSKNKEYDKLVEVVKELKMKQTDYESNQKGDIALLKGVVSKVQSKQESSNDEIQQIKEEVNQIKSQISILDPHRIVKRHNSIANKQSITTRLPCIPKNACAFDFKNSSLAASSSDKITTSTSASQKFDTAVSGSNGLMPSSCKDLSTKGHTLNGIYLFYDSKAKKVSTAFCDFNIKNGTQQFLGFLNVNSLPEGVYFFAQRTESFSNEDAIVPFDRILMNEGGGLNGTTGIFRAPKAGIYRFWLNCEKSSAGERLYIELKVNGVNVGDAYINRVTGDMSIAIHSVLNLKSGDEVYLFKNGDGILYDDATPDTQFSGWLVDEKLNH